MLIIQNECTKLQYIRGAFGFQNLMETSLLGGRNLSTLIGIGLACVQKIGWDQSPRPHTCRTPCTYSFYEFAVYSRTSSNFPSARGLLFMLLPLSYSLSLYSTYKQIEITTKKGQFCSFMSQFYMVY